MESGVNRREVVAAGLALPLAACGRRRDPDQVSLWAMDVEGENAKELLPAFQRASGLTVELQALPWTAAHEKLLTAQVGGSLPDVFMAPRGWIAEFAMLRAIRPVPPAAADLLADNFASDDLIAAGQTVAVPWTLDLQVQYYRRDLLARAGYDQPPAELGAWRDMLRAVKKRQGDGYAVLMQLNWPDHLLHIAAQSGEPMLRDRMSRGDFSGAGFRDALAFYRSLFDEGLAPRVTSIEAADPPGDLGRGWVAIYPAGGWIRAELLRRQDMLPRALWATAPMAGRGGAARSVVAGNTLCVSSTAADPARAWELVRYLTAPATALELNRIAGTLPSRPSAWRALASDPALRTFEHALATPVRDRRPMEWDRITGEVQQVAEQLVRGRLSLDDAVAEMDRRADAILAKRRWLLDRGRIA